MITYGTFRTRLARLLAETDPENPSDYPPDLLYQATIAAQEALLSWRWIEATEDYTGDNTLRLFDLPEDFFQPIYVILDGAPLPPARFQYGVVRGGSTNDWLVFANQLNLAKAPALAVPLTLLYKAHFPIPEDQDDLEFDLLIPSEAVQGLLYYACAVSLVPGITESADIRRWNDRQDSGNPEDNPIEKAYAHFHEMFLEEMKMLSKNVYG